MDKLFNPKSIAVIGASRHPEKLGYQILDNLIKSKFQGDIFPVNPEAKEILKLKAYPKVSDISSVVDLAVVIVPAPIVPEVLADCVKKDVSYAVIISSGFSEIGKKGKLLQDEIKDVIIKTSPLRVLGPNCLGVFNTENNLNATFAAPKLVSGRVAAVFQSGALGVALLDWAEKYEFGFSKFISLGNKVDIEEAEVIEYLMDDPQTKVIALYLEEIENPARFLKTARKASNKKPIIILKGGTTPLGAKAAFSHTAALISPSHVTKAIFAQSNLVVAETIEEMLNLIQTLSSEPPAKSKNVAIISNAGGPAILATDTASRTGVRLPPPTKELEESLKKVLPEVSSLHNPFDLTGEAKAKDYENALNLLMKNPNYSSIAVLLTPQTTIDISEVAHVLAKNAKASKPIVASFLGDRLVEEGKEILRKAKVPQFDDPQMAIKALSKISKYWERFFAKKDFVELYSTSPEIKPAGDALELVHRYNIPIPPSGIATTMDVAMKIVGRIGLPVAVKNVSKTGEHKFKAGKVILNVQSESFLKVAIHKLGFPVLIQRMVDSPYEAFVGAKRDKKLGAVLTFGWGGIFVEDLDDVSARILPLTEYDLDEMIKETKMGKILIQNNVNLSLIKNILVEVCQIMTDFPEITELDLNPVKITQDAAYCVDARYK